MTKKQEDTYPGMPEEEFISVLKAAFPDFQVFYRNSDQAVINDKRINRTEILAAIPDRFLVIKAKFEGPDEKSLQLVGGLVWGRGENYLINPVVRDPAREIIFEIRKYEKSYKFIPWNNTELILEIVDETVIRKGDLITGIKPPWSAYLPAVVKAFTMERNY